MTFNSSYGELIRKRNIIGGIPAIYSIDDSDYERLVADLNEYFKLYLKKEIKYGVTGTNET